MSPGRIRHLKRRRWLTRIKYILWKARPFCEYCGAALDDTNWSLDHVTPRCLGGTDDPINLRLCCERCNIAKGTLHPLLWFAKLEGGAA